MKRAALSLFSCCFLFACKGPGPGPALQLDVNGVSREYRLFVPAAPPEGAMPLLFAVHGGSGRLDPYPQQVQFEELAEEQGVVVVYPLSELLPGNEGEWQLNTRSDSRQDLDFIEALIDEVSAQHAIDSTRVYATGYSLGSMFVYELACHLSSRFAAFASHAGSMPVSPNSCDGSENAAVLHIHGVQDEIIPYGESWDWKNWENIGPMMDVPALVQFWADQSDCQDSSETESGSSTHVTHDNCAQGVRVEHQRLEQVGHEWPEQVEATSTHEVIWAFLSEFSRPE